MTPITCWLQSSLKRVFPRTPAGSQAVIELMAARNERVSFQACLNNASHDAVTVYASVAGPEDLALCLRRVGYVPMLHHNTQIEDNELDGVGHIPGYVPDPLYPESSVNAGPLESHAFWITVTVSAETKPGPRDVTVRFTVDDSLIAELTARIDVQSIILQPVNDFPITHWFYADALCDWYKVEPFEERFWRLVEPYMANLISHGNNCLYTPLFTPPTDGVKRPTQLVKVSTPSSACYEFNFSDVRRWVHLGDSLGARFFEWTHLFTQWGVQHALRIYRSNQDCDSLLWPPETRATSEIYRSFLAQFLPAFHQFLLGEKLLDRSFFHVSDEPHGDEHLKNYQKARALLKELAPWMKVMDAMSDLRFGQEGLTDIPIPSIGTARDYRAAGIDSWVYFCCGPRGNYLNRLMDTPLAKIRMSGWLFYRLKAKGFLHWGYNYWYKSQTQQLIDPFTEQAGLLWPGWAYGDTFVVYPGPEGPIDSIRWEIFAESIQDYALLQTLGLDPEGDSLSELKDYDDFPKKEAWIDKMRKAFLCV